MTTQRVSLLAAVATIAIAITMSAQPVHAEPIPDGLDACIEGYVWREARPGDTVCVKPEVAQQVAIQNANPTANRDAVSPGGQACIPRVYVYRDAFEGDTICVTPNFRQRMLNANANASAYTQANAWAPVPPAELPAG